MKNVLNIARKEFSDLLGSKIIILALAVYVLFIIISIYGSYLDLSQGLIKPDNVFENAVGGIPPILTYYGSFLAVMIGVSTIGIEKQNYALNTLIVKPLFRDTIINGKLLGAVFFLVCAFGLITILYVSGLFIVFGGYLAPYLTEFFIRLPIILVVSITCALVFLSVSMLLSILVRNQALAYILGIVVIVVDDTLKNEAFAGNIGYISEAWFGVNDQSIIHFVAGLSPTNLIYYIGISDAYSPMISLFRCVQIIEPYLMQLLLYLVVSVVSCYIVFLRRDIS